MKPCVVSLMLIIQKSTEFYKSNMKTEVLSYQVTIIHL